MSLEGVVHCDGPDCPIHQHVGSDTMRLGRLPVGWVLYRQYGGHGPESDVVERFCSNDCAMKKQAELPPTEVIPMDGGDE